MRTNAGVGVEFYDLEKGYSGTIGVDYLKDEDLENPQETLKKIMSDFDYSFFNPKRFKIYCFFLWKDNYDNWIDYRTL